MKNIVINYKICKNIDEDIIKQIYAGCSSEKYNVILNLYDFSTKKNVKSIIEKILSNVNNVYVFNQNYEDKNDADEIILNNVLQHADSLAFAIVPENMILNEFAIDEIDFHILENEVNGFLYFDYSFGGVKCYLRSRIPSYNMNILSVFLSTAKLIRFISEKDKIGIISSKFAGIHISKNLCSVYNNENEKIHS